jgi:hypothetical protein
VPDQEHGQMLISGPLNGLHRFKDVSRTVFLVADEASEDAAGDGLGLVAGRPGGPLLPDGCLPEAERDVAAPLPAEAAANPVVWSAKMLYERDSKNMIAAAEEMPADKYSYHPTPDQWTFGKVVSHIAQ